MANRHSHKKLRTETLKLMARSGLSYQKAREQLLAAERRVMAGGSAPAPDAEVRASAGDVDAGVDLIEATYFGIPVHIATASGRSTMEMVMVSRGAGVTGAIRPLRGPVHRPSLRS